MIKVELFVKKFGKYIEDTSDWRIDVNFNCYKYNQCLGGYYKTDEVEAHLYIAGKRIGIENETKE